MLISSPWEDMVLVPKVECAVNVEVTKESFGCGGRMRFLYSIHYRTRVSHHEFSGPQKQQQTPVSFVLKNSFTLGEINSVTDQSSLFGSFGFCLSRPRTKAPTANH